MGTTSTSNATSSGEFSLLKVDTHQTTRRQVPDTYNLYILRIRTSNLTRCFKKRINLTIKTISLVHNDSYAGPPCTGVVEQQCGLIIPIPPLFQGNTWYLLQLPPRDL